MTFSECGTIAVLNSALIGSAAAQLIAAGVAICVGYVVVAGPVGVLVAFETVPAGLVRRSNAHADERHSNVKPVAWLTREIDVALVGSTRTGRFTQIVLLLMDNRYTAVLSEKTNSGTTRCIDMEAKVTNLDVTRSFAIACECQCILIV